MDARGRAKESEGAQNQISPSGDQRGIEPLQTQIRGEPFGRLLAHRRPDPHADYRSLDQGDRVTLRSKLPHKIIGIFASPECSGLDVELGAAV